MNEETGLVSLGGGPGPSVEQKASLAGVDPVTTLSLRDKAASLSRFRAACIARVSPGIPACYMTNATGCLYITSNKCSKAPHNRGVGTPTVWRRSVHVGRDSLAVFLEEPLSPDRQRGVRRRRALVPPPSVNHTPAVSRPLSTHSLTGGYCAPLFGWAGAQGGGQCHCRASLMSIKGRRGEREPPPSPSTHPQRQL
ncbi:hypothetical protein DPEC_G00344130 [Dallia pectoralis]|uniref:Uncharacterized protein n=1 Tax=Dallia pectoralis TaxID=75939 RepID=A0ACC2F3A9_DALPE|nr:hypothetical protein DPEC_G00344130 [Dallia pectoralis]